MTIEEARAFFGQDRYAAESGIVLDEVTENGAVCHFEITDRHLNAEGGLMGGAIFTLIDFTFAVASSSRHRPTVAQQASVSFLNRARGRVLTARAVCRKDGRTSCVYNVDVTDDTGRDIAQAVMTGCKLPPKD